MPDITFRPRDAADERLLQQVHPPEWRNPQATGTYDLVVLGGGTAGLVSAVGAAGLGARVALVERHLLGGDCLHTGCVPSKALLRSARTAAELQRAAALGVIVNDARVDFAAVMRRLRERRASIAVHDSADRLRRVGVEVFFGEGRFGDARTIVVNGQRLRFNRAVIATGGRPAIPPVRGIDAAPYFTNETIFSIAALPRRLVVIGAGPIGCELGQAFARIGSAVTLLGRGPHVLPRESPGAGAVVQKRLQSDGVRLELGVQITEVSAGSDGIAMRFEKGSGANPSGCVIEADAILVAAGRMPNIETLSLEAAGVRADRNGIIVNDRLQTSNSRVFASGDVCSAYKFTHAADAMSRIVLENALFFGRRKVSGLIIPWTTFTDPEVAHVGATRRDVEASGGRLETISVPLSDVDRAVVDEETDGFVEVHHEGGRVCGCTIVARHAGEMIGEVVGLMMRGGSVASLSSTIHPYPTLSNALGKAGDAYRRQALTPVRRRWLRRYFRWTR